MVDEMRQILIERFEKQDTKTGFYDVTFTIQNKLLHAHRFLLSTSSEPFQAMFSKAWSSNNEPIEIKTCTFETFKQFISYFYHGKCNFNETIIFDIIDLAEMYQIQPLKNQFDAFLSEMSFTDANIYKLLEILESHKFEKLKVSLGNYLVGNWRTLFERDDFLKANKNVYLGILELDRDRNQNIENSLFLKVFIWAENQAREKAADFETLKIEDQQKLIKEEMSEFLPKFKFNFRSVPFLNDVVAEKRYLFDDWNGILENARNSRDFIDDDDIKFFVKFQILPKDFNGRYHQVLRGFVYAESYEPLNKMVELIQTFHLENGAYKNRTPSNASLELASYLEYFDDSTQYIFGVNRHCGDFAVINADCFENNDYYEYKKLCYLEGNNFPAFEEEEENFFVQFL